MLTDNRHVDSERAFTISKLTIETLEQSVINMLEVNNKDTRTPLLTYSRIFLVFFCYFKHGIAHWVEIAN